MLPGMNSRKMKQMMKQMGIDQEEVEADQVVIKCPDKEIVISNAQVTKIDMQGQETWQVMGKAQERALDSSPDISDEDVETVMEQTGSSEDEAKAAIDEADGDLAEAIMKLQE